MWKIVRWIKDCMQSKPYWCTNCGIPVTGSVRCRMVDRCVPSQNNIIWRQCSAEDMAAMMQAGLRVFTDDARALCASCAEENHYVCYCCELDSIQETKR